MMLTIIMLGCWISGYVLAAGVIQDPSLLVRNVHLHRRDPVRDFQSEKRSRHSPVGPPMLNANVHPDPADRFKGSTFVKNERYKQVLPGANGWYRHVHSRKKTSAGGTQNQPGRLIAEAEGPNVGIKLHVPEGSKGTYYTKSSAGKVVHTIDHTQSPFRWNVPKQPDGRIITAGAEIDGPGSVKAKAWNE